MKDFNSKPMFGLKAGFPKGIQKQLEKSDISLDSWMHKARGKKEVESEKNGDLGVEQFSVYDSGVGEGGSEVGILSLQATDPR